MVSTADRAISTLPYPARHASPQTPKPPPNPFRWFDSSPEVIPLGVMLYVREPLALRNVEDLAHERGVDIHRETVRLWVSRFGPMFASVHASLHNPFNQERHLVSRRIYKDRRSAAPAERRAVAS